MVVGLVITLPPAALSGVPAHLGSSSAVWLAISGIGNVGGLVLTYRALRVGQVALVAPLVSTEGAVAAVIAVIAGESVAPGVALTLVAILAGVWLASVEETPGLEPTSSSPRVRLRPELSPGARVRRTPTYAILFAIAGALDLRRQPVCHRACRDRVSGVLGRPVSTSDRDRRPRDPAGAQPPPRDDPARRPAGRHLGGVRGPRLLLVHDGRPARHRGGRRASSQVGGLAALGGVFPVRRAAQPQGARLGVCTMLAGVAVLSALRA